MAGKFDHARDLDLIENLAGYVSEVVAHERDGRSSIGLLLSMPRRTRDEAISDALLLVAASCSAPVLDARVVTLNSWRTARRDAVTSLAMPGALGPTPDLLTREARSERDGTRRLHKLVSRHGARSVP